MMKALCRQGRVEWTKHAMDRIHQRGITIQEVEDVILNGEAIESYPDDYPFPSCLVLWNGIHVVCSVGQGYVWIITAYRPNPKEWENDLRTRRRREE